MITINRNVLNNTGVWINPRAQTATPPMVNDRPILPIRSWKLPCGVRASQMEAASIPIPRADHNHPSSIGPTCSSSLATTGRRKTNALMARLYKTAVIIREKTTRCCKNTNRNPTIMSCITGVDSTSSPFVVRVSRTRIGKRNNAETKKVAASTYSTFCAPISAIPKPLMAGPSSTPMLVVLWINAFAVVSWERCTMSGTADARAGPKIVETIEIRNTRTYNRSSVSRSKV